MKYSTQNGGRARLLSRSLLTASSLALMATPAFAQDGETEEEDDVIIVTGSRIALDSAVEAASPISTVTGEQIATGGDADIGTLLRTLPALQGSLPGIDSVNQAGPAGDSSGLGLSVLNLRGLGTVRTLTLVDGRRHVPGLAGSQAVDLNHIPQSRIKNVEVFTGGASSVYGADAVTGVVNFTLRTGRDFDGLEYNVRGGITDEGDAENFSASIALGGEFADGRGSAVFSAEYRKQTSIIAADRDFAGTGIFGLSAASQATLDLLGFSQADLGLPDGTLPSQAFVPNRTLPITSPFGLIALTGSAFSAGVATARNGAPILIDGTNIPRAQVFDNGTLRAFDPGVSVGGFDSSGGDGIGGNDNSIIVPRLDQIVVSAGADYEITSGVEAFFEGTFAFTDGLDQTGTPFSDDIPIQSDNPFIPAALAAQTAELDNLGIDNQILVSRDILDLGVNPQQQTDRTTWRIVGGLRGEIADNWDWEVSYTYGRTQVESTFLRTRLEDRYYFAIDAVAITQDDIDNGFGTITALRNGEGIEINPGSALVGDVVCRSELDGTAPGVSPFPQPPTDADGNALPLTFTPQTGQCAPINIFGRNAISGPGVAFAFPDILDTSNVTQQQFLATFGGDRSSFFELPGGPIGIAAGFEYRRDTTLFVPSTFRNSPAITAGAVNAGPTFTSPDPSFVDPTLTVYEGFGEIRAPILADMRFVDLLEVQGAVRFSDYNTIGRTTAYSFGGRYAPIEDITFRGTYSVSVRAPNLSELFGPLQPATIGLTADPCSVININAGSAFREANCNALVGPGFDPTNFASAFRPGQTGGNPGLTEEEATTFTAGFVFEPSFIPGFRLIADFYDIEIEGGIGSLTGQAIANNCVDLPTTNNQFCDAVDRDPATGVISFFRSGNINLSSINAQGIDFAASYNFDVADVIGSDAGSVALSLTGTHFLQDEVISDQTAFISIAAIEDPLEQEVALILNNATNDRLGEFGRPEWIANFGITWSIDDFTLGYQGRFESSQLSPGLSNENVIEAVVEGGQVVVRDDNTFVALPQRDTGSSIVSNFTFAYDFDEKLNFYGGINNAFDVDPYLGSLVRPIGVRGRFFYLGVRGQF